MGELERVRNEMIKRGCSKSMTESKSVAVVLDIINETGSQFKDFVDEEKELEEAERRLNREQFNFQIKMSDAKYELDKRGKVLDARERELNEFANELAEKLEQLETKEARDRVRLAHFYMKYAKPTNGYEKTAFIKGLSYILSDNPEEEGM